jgi:uncharacterized SAM-binding protein YcdF (DUF218 family)
MKDAIIILGGSTHPDGSLRDIPKHRVDEGVRLLKTGIAPRIIMSGGYSFWLDETGEIPAISEAEAMRNYALSLGVSDNQILIEKKSKDTLGNAYYTKVDFLEKNDWHTLLVVTSDFHMDRTRFLFDTVLGPEYSVEYVSVPTDMSPEKRLSFESAEKITIDVLRNIIGLVRSGDTQTIEKALFARHPGYSTHPEISFDQLKELLGRGARKP